MFSECFPNVAKPSRVPNCLLTVRVRDSSKGGATGVSQFVACLCANAVEFLI
jgi:hypothetical protein